MGAAGFYVMEAYMGMLHADFQVRVGFQKELRNLKMTSGKTWGCGIEKVMGTHLSALYIFV